MSSDDHLDPEINFYLEKTFSQNPSDVAHLLKYFYYPYIRYDTKNWYHFHNHQWTMKDEDKSPLLPLIRNDLVNKYLSLANQYNQRIMKLTTELMSDEELQSSDDQMSPYLPLIISDLMYRSKVCSELGLKLTNHSYNQKVNMIAQELFTQKDFELILDSNPNLLGFNNGNLNLVDLSLNLPKYQDKVFMSVGYDYTSLTSTNYQKDVTQYFNQLGLSKMLPVLGSLLSGQVRQPVIWVTNLSEPSMNGIGKLLEYTLGDYLGSLQFSMLRKRKIPHYQNHTHSDLVMNCRKRLILVEQLAEDYPSVNPQMIDTLISQDTLNLRKPYETTNDYRPQFGLIILSVKEDTEPIKSSMVFTANKDTPPLVPKPEWAMDLMKILLSYQKR